VIPSVLLALFESLEEYVEQLKEQVRLA